MSKDNFRSLNERYLVILEGQPITVDGKYHWNKYEASDIERNLKQKLYEKIEETSNALKAAHLEIQLDSIMIKQVVFN